MKTRLLYFISPLTLLVIWELLVTTGILDRRFFPAPSEVFVRLFELLRDGTLVTATIVTLRRMIIGFLLATIPGVFIGLMMGISRTTRIILSPLIASLYPVPKIALVPMVVILFGIGENSKYAIVVISVFFLVVINTMAGVMNVEERYFDIARNNGARRWDLVWSIALPASLPSILTGINLGLGFALTVIVGTELLLPQGGIGALIWKSYQLYDIATIFAGLIVVAVIGWGFNTLMLEMERQLLPWRALSGNRRAPRLEDEPMLRRFVRTWWMAIRPFSLTASVTPVVLGSVLAAYDGAWNWSLFAITLIGSVALHAGTNLINDYYDLKKGADTQESLGPNRALKEGMLTSQQVFWGGIFCFALGSVLGIYLVATRGYFILYLGIFSVLAGWFTHGWPRRLCLYRSRRNCGLYLYGPVIVLGSYFVMTQSISPAVIWMAAPVGLLVAAILHANNMRDLEADRDKNKRTLANILGREASRWEYYILISGSYLILVALVILRVAPPFVLLALLTLPSAIDLIRTTAIHDAPARLNKVLRGTATLHERFGWLMITGVIVAIAAQVA